MTDFEVGDHVKFASGRGEFAKIEERPNGSHLHHVYTSEGQLRKLPNGLPHIEKFKEKIKAMGGDFEKTSHISLRGSG